MVIPKSEFFQIMKMEIEQTLILSSPKDALRKGTMEHAGEESEDIDPHSAVGR